MSKGNGETAMSLEDSIRAIFPTTEERQAFRAQWPMYDVSALEEAIEKADDDIKQFEEAIINTQRKKREWSALADECKRRDNALANVTRGKQNA